MSYKNPMATHKNDQEKRRAFHYAAAERQIAWDCKGREYLLRDLNPQDVEYIAGAWRVQNKFDHKIQVVRGEEFVLGARLNRTERNHFEFFSAQMVGLNCYGRFLVNGPNVIVAKYETDDETHWAYGHSIEQARAFLGISLYDKYRELIHATACKRKLARDSK